ncbi:MAG: PBP1A family penicillin-binding protein [Pseudomonadota bacterium]|nr:PBP1A family penicillin-binding protein [Pseudomonadota bacterium]
MTDGDDSEQPEKADRTSGPARALALLKQAGAALAEAARVIAAEARDTARDVWSRLASRTRALRLGAAAQKQPAEPRGDLFDDAPAAPPVEGAAENRGKEPLLAAERSAPMPADPPITAPKGPRLAAPRPPRPKRARRKPPGPMVRELMVDIGWLAGSLSLTAIAGGLFVAFVLVAPRVPAGADLWAANRQTSIVILDRNGDEIAARGSRYGERVAVSDLPPYLVKAFIATEDRRFYEHRGVDLRGTARAFMTNLKHGGVVEGGSTITQQLARNLFLSLEQTYVRKAREALLALWLEGRYSKDEILSLYLNRIYLGAGAYGVEAAAKTYFGKSARDVSLSEAVMLAGLPKAPSSLAPTQNPFGAQKRAGDVLDNLVETGAITEFDAREARKHPPVIAAGEGDVGLGYFFDYIAAKARDMAGGRRGDLIVTTTLDARMQRDAQAAVASVISTETKLAGAEQAALVAYDVNGALRAMVGGVSYVESQFNRATQARRQPGSAFKPFVYIAALEAGLTPQSAFVDQPINIDGWEPKNYGEGYQGRMRLTEAVAKSVNTIAVQASEFAGRDKVVEAAHRMGIQSNIQPVPSIALGGANMTLEELTGAYIPLARGGTRVEPYAIQRIEDQNLQVIYQHRDEEPVQVLSRQTATDINYLLFQVMNSGTGAGASLGGRVSAGKTGTTNDWRDAWFVGYTAQIVAGVWVGNDAYTPMNHVTGGTLPARIWKNFMLAAHQNLPRKPIEGAVPAPLYADEREMLSFYSEIARDLRDVRNDGRERRGRKFWRDR